MKQKIIIIFSFLIIFVLNINAEELYLSNDKIISPETKKRLPHSSSYAITKTAENLISPFYPDMKISESSLDNGYELLSYNLKLYLCYIDGSLNKLVIKTSFDNKTWSTPVTISDVKYNLSNGSSFKISNNTIFICWADNGKLYFSKSDLNELAFEKILISSKITGIPCLQINNEQLNILVSKNMNPAIFKSFDSGLNWKEYNDISKKKLSCVNNPSYGIAKPQIINAGNNRMISAYASPELSIQVSNNNGITWTEPKALTEQNVLNGFALNVEYDKLNYSYIEQGELKSKTISLHSIGIVAGGVAAANLNNVVVYPNPFKPSESINGYVTFANVTRDIEIKIYTIAGELVDEMSLTNTTGTVSWDCRNKSNENVVSGVYLYLMKNSSEEKKTGKIVVIR